MGDTNIKPCFQNAIFFTSEDLSQSFGWGVAQEVASFISLSKQRRRGVYYCQVDNESMAVRIIGTCPNWTEAGCRKGENCLSVIRERG